MVAQVKVQPQTQVPVEISIPATMTAAWFDAAIARSFEKELAVKPLGQGRYAMQSSREASLTYVVTADSCQCEGFRHYHKCYHACRAAFEDAFEGPVPPPPTASAWREPRGFDLDNRIAAPTLAEREAIKHDIALIHRADSLPGAAIGPGRRCPGCAGDGRQRVHDEDGVVTIEQCLICRGSGWIAAPGLRQPVTVLGIPTMRYSSHDAYDHRTCGYCLGDGYCCDRPATAKLLPPKAA